MEIEQLSVEEMASRFRRCAAATVYDVLEAMGLPDQCVAHEMRPLRSDMVVAGPAFTIRGMRDPRNLDEPTGEGDAFPVWEMFQSMYPGCCLVINAEKEEQVGHWGEMMSYTSRTFGARGVVIDGGIRDMPGLLQIPDWPVFARYTTPIEMRRRFRFDEFQVPIYMTGTTRRVVRVNPGDWIVGDCDGVLVVPQEMAQEALVKCEEIEELERGSRRDLAAGVDPRVVFERYKRL